MDLDTALAWAADRKHAVLVTLRQDGRAQTSDVNYAVQDGALVLSVTADRAKTRNAARDPRVVLHVSEPATWSYVSFDGLAELSPVTAEPGDATSDGLVAYYTQVAGQHPDWDEYRRAMVQERRLLLRVRPGAAVGQIHG